MTSSPNRARHALTAVVSAAVLAGCVGATNADRDRLEAINDDPLMQVAPPGLTPTDTISRGETLATGDNAAASETNTTTGRTYLLPVDTYIADVLRHYADHMTGNGWQDITMSCVDINPIRLRGRRSYGGYAVDGQVIVYSPEATNRLFDGATGVGVDLSIRVSYHTSAGGSIAGNEPDLDCLEELEASP
jgi:hypothetical protein